MRKYLDEFSTINTIRLELRHPAGKNFLWILVEGETDQRLYARLINGCNTKVEMIHGGGVENLRTAVSTLVTETRQVIGIRDADFLYLDKKPETIAYLFLTDVHDAEMMLLSCDEAFESVIAEHLPVRLNDFKNFRNQLLASLIFLGGMRWLNDTECLEFNFKGGLNNFYDANNLTLDKFKCIQEIATRSPNKKRTLQVEEVISKVANISDHYNLCNGHDVEKAFAQHVTIVNKSVSNTKGVKDTDIGKALRIAYRKEDFKTTNLHASLRNWEIQTGYTIF